MAALTPVEIVSRRPAFRTGRLEVWAARSTDGLWTYERTEEAGTPWVVTHVPTGRWDLFGSLPRARRFTARPTAAAWFASLRDSKETAPMTEHTLTGRTLRRLEQLNDRADLERTVLGRGRSMSTREYDEWRDLRAQVGAAVGDAAREVVARLSTPEWAGETVEFVAEVVASAMVAPEDASVMDRIAWTHRLHGQVVRAASTEMTTKETAR